MIILFIAKRFIKDVDDLGFELSNLDFYKVQYHE